MHIIKWSELCEPIDEDGLGIRESRENNMALLHKTCWRCITNEDIFSTSILKAKYCPKKYLWKAKFRKGNSWLWTGFVDAVEFINDNVGWVIREGSDISVWKGNWIPYEQDFRKQVSQISNPNLKVRRPCVNNRNWDVSKISNAFNNHKDVEDILEIYISFTEMKGKRVRYFSKDENLSTKSAKKILSKSNDIINWKKI